MKTFKILDWVAFVLVVIGGINWGLWGFFHFDLVEYLFGDWTMIARVIYDVIGIAAVYMVYAAYRCKDNCKNITTQ